MHETVLAGRDQAHLSQAVEDLPAGKTLCEGLDGMLAIEEDDRIASLSWIAVVL